MKYTCNNFCSSSDEFSEQFWTRIEPVVQTSTPPKLWPGPATVHGYRFHLLLYRVFVYHFAFFCHSERKNRWSFPKNGPQQVLFWATTETTAFWNTQSKAINHVSEGAGTEWTCQSRANRLVFPGMRHETMQHWPRGNWTWIYHYTRALNNQSTILLTTIRQS